LKAILHILDEKDVPPAKKGKPCCLLILKSSCRASSGRSDGYALSHFQRLWRAWLRSEFWCSHCGERADQKRRDHRDRAVTGPQVLEALG
jgi:hypothetical protein